MRPCTTSVPEHHKTSFGERSAPPAESLSTGCLTLRNGWSLVAIVSELPARARQRSQQHPHGRPQPAAARHTPSRLMRLRHFQRLPPDDPPTHHNVPPPKNRNARRLHTRCIVGHGLVTAGAPDGPQGPPRSVGRYDHQSAQAHRRDRVHVPDPAGRRARPRRRTAHLAGVVLLRAGRDAGAVGGLRGGRDRRPERSGTRSPRSRCGCCSGSVCTRWPTSARSGCRAPG